jgi:cell wall-associated NlpC family hydrolase
MTLPGEKNGQRTFAGVVAALSCWLLLGGCTPKRVVNNEILTGDERPAAAPPKPAPAPDGLPKVEVPPAAGFGERAAALARQQMGKMYQWGGVGPDRFDCSGLVYFVYGKLGVAMPRVSSRQARMGREVTRPELQPGDMVYFATNGGRIDHVGIYLGKSRFVHAPRKGMPVRIDNLDNGWWRQKYRGARRIKS